MISTNLSTRPFYNERLVHLVLLALAILVLAVTGLNAWTYSTLSRRDAVQNAQAVRADQKANEAKRAADRIRRGINPDELGAATMAAVEANRLIDQRTFSWTRLLSEFEQTLPSDVRISGVTPKLDREGRLFVDIYVVGRRAEDINEFAEKLEARGAFTDIRWTDETVNPEGLRETTLNGRYVGSARRTN
jgi:hypothetical protein